MATNTRTMIFQIPEDLFQRIKTHLECETQRTGRKLTQQKFVLGLIKEALEAAERQTETNWRSSSTGRPGRRMAVPNPRKRVTPLCWEWSRLCGASQHNKTVYERPSEYPITGMP